MTSPQLTPPSHRSAERLLVIRKRSDTVSETLTLFTNPLALRQDRNIVTITPSSSLSTGSIVVTVTPAGVNDLAGNTGTPTGSTTTVTVSFAHKIRPTVTVENDNVVFPLPK